MSNPAIARDRAGLSFVGGRIGVSEQKKKETRLRLGLGESGERGKKTGIFYFYGVFTFVCRRESDKVVIHKNYERYAELH